MAVGYVSDSTPMLSYINAHIALEQRRDKADETHSTGPRVCMRGADKGGMIGRPLGHPSRMSERQLGPWLEGVYERGRTGEICWVLRSNVLTRTEPKQASVCGAVDRGKVSLSFFGVS